MGFFGDFAICSFTPGKILDIGDAGGLIVKNKNYLDMCREIEATFPEKNSIKNYDLISLSHRNLYMAAVDLLRSNRLIKSLDTLKKFQKHYQKLYKYRCPFGTNEYKERLRLDFQD